VIESVNKERHDTRKRLKKRVRAVEEGKEEAKDEFG
jgi:hypothetical protein